MNDKYILDELESKIIDTVSSYLDEKGLGEHKYSIVLSGGFDSGLLAAITKPYKAYRIKFPYGTKFDESRYAEAISRHLNLDVEEIIVTPENFKEYFEEAVKIMGEPTPHFSLVPLYILFKTLSERGETDVLSGEGPDEYLGGYARQIIVDELKKIYEIPELRNYHSMIDKFLGMDLVTRYGEILGYPLEKVEKYAMSDYPLQGKIGKMDMELGHIEKMEQKFAKHFGISFHYPYIDSSFAEYCYRLPDDLKIRNGVTKWGFREIAMKYLPKIMKNRSKMGGPVAPVNRLMGWELPDFDKTEYLKAQEKILHDSVQKN